MSDQHNNCNSKNEEPSPLKELKDSPLKILVTGAAGFIGHALCKRLLEGNNLPSWMEEKRINIIGLDNINDYYDPELKYGRLADLGINKNNIEWNKLTQSDTYSNFKFTRMNLEDDNEITGLFDEKKFDVVINLAAQAGVRYSIDHPRTYIKSNIDGFINVLEGCRNTKVKHLIYASSSSVYGLNGKVPFSEHDGTNHPVSLYAATKKSNELMAHAYSQLYNLPTTGLRFFTVYGPWGRPDMSPFLFMDAILNDRPIKVFNNGDMLRDFTYIDDIIESIIRLIDKIPQGLPVKQDPLEEGLSHCWDPEQPDPATSPAPYRIYNIGNSHPVKLMDYIKAIEAAAGKEAIKNFLPMQPGDVYQTSADTSELEEVTGYKPFTPLKLGINETVKWFKEFKVIL